MTVSLQQQKKIKNTISEYIDELEKTYPYADLPLAEMNRMNDIAAYIKVNDIISVSRKINELTCSYCV